MPNTQPDIFDEMAAAWPSEIIARPKINEFTGGLLDGKTLANYASQGLPVPPVVRVGRKVAYLKKPFCQWLRQRAERGQA